MLVQVGSRRRSSPLPQKGKTGTRTLSPELRLVLKCLDANRLISAPINGVALVVGRSCPGYSPEINLEVLGAIDQGVSRRHAQFTLRDGDLFVEDLGSTNGTRINGFKVASNHSYRLRNGDEIEFGNIRLNVSLLRIPSR
ncbi:MAG: FHA domain-containing protein [Chloroflexi bacterium]|nr:FHA domain-containing protein [Chloroflexota bacterium]